MQGNVALDVARILLRCKTELATTDIADYALDALRGSTIRYLFTLILKPDLYFFLCSLLPYITDDYIIHNSLFMLHVKEGTLGWATGSRTSSMHSKGVA